MCVVLALNTSPLEEAASILEVNGLEQIGTCCLSKERLLSLD